MKKEADVESVTCGQEKLENNELCRSQVLMRSEKEREHLLALEFGCW